MGLLIKHGEIIKSSGRSAFGYVAGRTSELEVTFGTKTSCQINEEILFEKDFLTYFPAK